MPNTYKPKLSLRDYFILLDTAVAAMTADQLEHLHDHTARLLEKKRKLGGYRKPKEKKTA